jgi:hypothetical protein
VQKNLQVDETRVAAEDGHWRPFDIERMNGADDRPGRPKPSHSI